MKMTKEEIEEITFDPSRDEVLGVFGEEVHIKIEDVAVLITSKQEYLRVWANWLAGKQDRCEFSKYYCGVGGYTSPEIIEQLPDNIVLNEWSQSDEDMKPIEYPIFKVTKFKDYHDFEHG